MCLELIKVLLKEYEQLLKTRYKLEEISSDGLKAMEQIARRRGFLFSGNRIDYERTARTVLDEFRAGKIRPDYAGTVRGQRKCRRAMRRRAGRRGRKICGAGERQ